MASRLRCECSNGLTTKLTEPLSCNYIEVYSLRYTVYDIWHTRISVVETTVTKRAFYISIYTEAQVYAILVYLEDIRVHMETCTSVFVVHVYS